MKTRFVEWSMSASAEKLVDAKKRKTRGRFRIGDKVVVFFANHNGKKGRIVDYDDNYYHVALRKTPTFILLLKANEMRLDIASWDQEVI